MNEPQRLFIVVKNGAVPLWIQRLNLVEMMSASCSVSCILFLTRVLLKTDGWYERAPLSLTIPFKMYLSVSPSSWFDIRFLFVGIRSRWRCKNQRNSKKLLEISIQLVSAAFGNIVLLR
jgi:hypothetical protein